MELKVNEYQLPAEIQFNFDELKMELTASVSKYETMVYTEEQIKEAKADRANLNKLKKALNDERIRREREYLKPFEDFKTRINEIIAIIDKPVAVIDKQIKAAEQKKKDEKRVEIGSIFTVLRFPDWVRLPMIWDESWLNSSTSMKQIEDNLNGWKARIETEVKTLEELPENSFEAIETYKATLDMNKAIVEARRLADMQKRKAEIEAKIERQKEIERLEAERAKEQAIAEMHEADEALLNAPVEAWMTPPQADEPQAEQPKNDGAVWVKFEALLTVENAGKLREFFVSNGIEFRAI